VIKHNGYKIDGTDSFLPGALAFLKSIPEKDLVIFITSRKKEQKAMTEDFLSSAGIRFDLVIYNAPYGERILINDNKPSGLHTAIAVNPERDSFIDVNFEVDDSL
jgi:23S rRNA G2445 N2-methylase RlmL